MIKLEPCPFCGGSGEMKNAQTGKIRQGWVGCPKCGCYINWKFDPQAAAEKWNRRANNG